MIITSLASCVVVALKAPSSKGLNMQRSPTCGNCLKNYEFKDFRPVGSHIPLLLSCGHSFCEGCLMRLGRKKESIECPKCKKETKLEPDGERGVKNLLPDIYLLGVLTYNKRAALESGQNRVATGPLWNFGNIHHLTARKEKAEEGDEKKDKGSEDKQDGAASAKMVACEECSAPATCICKSCDDCTFCESCFIQYHKILKRLQKHVPMPLSYPRKSEMECSDHSGRVLEFFDKTANEPICALCVIAENRKGNEIVPLGELDTELQKDLETSLLNAKKTLSCLKTSEKLIATAVPEMSILANQFMQEVRDFFNNMHSALQIRESAILEEAAGKYRENFSFTSLISDCIEQQKSVQSAIKDSEFLCQQPQVLRLKINEILSKLDEFKNIKCCAKRIERQDQIRFTIDEEKANLVKEIGGLEAKGGCTIEMLKMEDLTDEEKNFEKLSQSRESIPIKFIEENELLDEDNAITPELKQHVSYNAGILARTSYELVYVTYVRTPENFFIQRCSDKDRLQHMMHNLNKYCRNSDKPEDLVFCPKKDDLICAQFLADNNWYRARIISPRSQQQPNTIPSWENGLPVEVQYIDYGNKESLPLARLRKMKPQFLEVPELAVACSLVEIVPPNQLEKWPLNAIKAFNSLVGENPMLMNIRCRFDGRLYVDLKRPDDLDEPTKDDDRPISVRDALVFLEVARFRSPESISTVLPKTSRQYKEPILPEPEEQTDVIITHVVSPHEIYVQKFVSPMGEVHEELAKICAGRKKEGNSIPFPYRNLVCAAKFSEDKMWYRGLITNVYDDCKIEVKFVDYGNSEKTSLMEIRKLPDSCLNLRKQAFLVRLKDVGVPNGDEKWSPEATKFLTEMILNKPLVLITKVIEDGVPQVEFCDTSTEEDIYINHVLVQKGFAVSTGPSSDHKPFLMELEERPGDDGYVNRDDENAASSGGKSNDIVASYPIPVLPADNIFKVIGTYVNSQGYISGHKMDKAEDEARMLRLITQKLNDGEIASLPGLQNTENLHLDQACVAQFSDDRLWYRAVIACIVDKQHAEVEFIDFGNTEVVHASNVRLETPLLNIPRQALKFRLFGIEPIDESRNGRYAEEAISTLNAVMVNQTFTVHLKGIQRNPVLLVASIFVETGEDLAVGLVTAGFAKKTEQGVQNEDEGIHRLAALSLDNGFIQPTLPQIGIHFDVTVTQVESPNVVFIQRLSVFDDEEEYSNDPDDTEEIAKEQLEQLRRMSSLMNSDEFFDDNSSLERIESGIPCCAQYSRDEEWYRGKIKSVNRKDDDPSGEVTSADVLFVDYGTREKVPVDRLKRIPEDFLELPTQAVLCELAALYPPEQIDKNEEFFRDTNWPVSTLRALYDIVADKRMIACILDYGPPVKILLFDRINSDENETGETMDVLVGKMLGDRKLAIFDLERYQSSPEETRNRGSVV